MLMRLRLAGFFFLILFLDVNSQVPALLRSTFSIGGAPGTLYSNGHKVMIPQSIGQLSVSGIFTGNRLELRQGYIQPITAFKTQVKEEENKVSVWPNPFVSEVFIKPDKSISGNIDLTVTDLAGRIVYKGGLPTGEPMIVNLEFLPRGLYLLRIRNKNLQFNCKIIKD
jgi:hypothetical protein